MKKYTAYVKRIAVFVASVLFVPLANILPASATPVWTNQTGAGTRSWSKIAMSADGSHLVGVLTSGDIFTSADYGVTWADRTAAGSRNWYAVSMSSDGSHIVAGVLGGDIYTSADYGATWADRTAAGSRSWRMSTSSSDGSHLALAVSGGGDIYTSADYGATWADRTAAGSRSWVSLAGSSDGSHLIAGVSSGDVFTSTDYGATWTDHTTAPHTNGPVTSSSDGSHLAGVMTNGDIYTSTDYGSTWTDRTASSGKSWTALASSSDGSHLIGVTFGFIYISTDYGATWTSQTTPGSGLWAGAASSSDGSRLAASYTNIWTYYDPPTVSDNGLGTGVEAAGPNSGDANNDGTADSAQSNVASFVNTATNKYTSVSMPVACTISLVGMTNGATADIGYTYPAGLINYTAGCGTSGYTATVNLYIYGATGTDFVLRKYNTTTHTYTTVNGVTFTQTTIGGQAVVVSTYQVTDGGALDQDGTANGTIVDPVGVAQQNSSPTNGAGGTLSDTGLNIAATSGVAVVLLAAAVVAWRHKAAYRLLR
jgi:photosystem II stability/assembly factor-like uncharacterized protein